MTSDHNPARTHHYLPRFYLNEFVNPAGKVWRTYLGPDGQLHEHAHAPKGTGFEEDLYSLEREIAYEQSPRSDAVETDILQPIDDRAAKAMQRLVSAGPSALDDTERCDWAVFVNSLLERCPERLAARDETAREVSQGRVAQFLEARLAAGEEEWIRVLRDFNHYGVAMNAVRLFMTNEISAPEVIEYFKGMVWLKCHIDGPMVQFVTADVPVVVNVGQPGPIQLMSLALGPKDLLFMCQSEIPEIELANMALLHNLLLYEQASYVFSQVPLYDGMPIKDRTAAEKTLRKKNRWPNLGSRKG
jgi:hypothetical protein